MGGKGSGGSRPGSGRKPKGALEHGLDGTVSQVARVFTHPSSAPAEIEEFDAPDDLTMDERHVWMELAPFAFQNRTLTKATSLAFRILCRNVVLERAFAQSVNDKGTANHRGMIQRVDAELRNFNLLPCGKPIYEAAPVAAANPLQRFIKKA